MNLITAKALAELTGIPEKNVHTYKGRKKVIADKRGLYDTDNPVNALFIENRQAKMEGEKPEGSKQIPRSETYVEPDAEDMEPDENGYMTLGESERMKQHYQAIRNLKAVEISDIEIAKKKGSLIPPDLIKPLFQQHNQSIVAEMKAMNDTILREIAKQYNIPLIKISEYKGRWVDELNNAIDRAKKLTATGLKNIVNNFQESK